MTQLDDGLLFMVWFVVGIMLILFPTFMTIKSNSLKGLRFDEKYPNLAWVRVVYTFFPIIWIPLSIIFTGRILQNESTLTFFVFIVFIPLIGLGILKGLIEIGFKVSSHLRFRTYENGQLIRLGTFRRKYVYDYYFSFDTDHVRSIGFFRLFINIGMLATMIYFLK
jgi:hypothetical protein